MAPAATIRSAGSPNATMTATVRLWRRSASTASSRGSGPVRTLPACHAVHAGELVRIGPAASVSTANIWPRCRASPAGKGSFADLTIGATETYISDTVMSIDSFARWRGAWDELQRRKDGITLDAAGLPLHIRAFVNKMMPHLSRAASDEAWLKSTKDPQLSTAAAFGVIVARNHEDAVQRLQVGRIYQRLHLWATIEGLAVQPINQTVDRRDRELSAGLPPGLASRWPRSSLSRVGRRSCPSESATPRRHRSKARDDR